MHTDHSRQTRDPRLPTDMKDNPAFVDDSDKTARDAAIAEMQLMRTQNTELKAELQELSALVRTAFAGRNLAGEILTADPGNPYPRPLTHRGLDLPGAVWAPLVPMEGNPLFQAVLARAGSQRSLGSVSHELPFLYSSLSYAHDALHNLRLVQQQYQQGEVPEEAFEASLALLDKVVRLGGKRYTEIQVMVDHDVPTAALLHLQNFGPAAGSRVMDAGDRALLIDVRKQEMKEQKKTVLKGKSSGKGGSGGKPKPSNTSGPAMPAGPRT